MSRDSVVIQKVRRILRMRDKRFVQALEQYLDAMIGSDSTRKKPHPDKNAKQSQLHK